MNEYAIQSMVYAYVPYGYILYYEKANKAYHLLPAVIRHRQQISRQERHRLIRPTPDKE